MSLLPLVITMTWCTALGFCLGWIFCEKRYKPKIIEEKSNIKINEDMTDEEAIITLYKLFYQEDDNFCVTLPSGKQLDGKELHLWMEIYK